MYIPKTHNNIRINLYLFTLILDEFPLHDSVFSKRYERYFLIIKSYFPYTVKDEKVSYILVFLD